MNFSALCLRTLPNPEDKRKKSYSGTNPPYLTEDAAKLISSTWKVSHFVFDLPSVDKENDGGLLRAHRALWNAPSAGDLSTSNSACKTITELAYFPKYLSDGYYILDLQTVNLNSDATMSRPVLFPATNLGNFQLMKSPSLFYNREKFDARN